jgi:hypothetical protein
MTISTGSIAITKGTVVVHEQAHMMAALLEHRKHFW